MLASQAGMSKCFFKCFQYPEFCDLWVQQYALGRKQVWNLWGYCINYFCFTELIMACEIQSMVSFSWNIFSFYWETDFSYVSIVINVPVFGFGVRLCIEWNTLINTASISLLQPTCRCPSLLNAPSPTHLESWTMCTSSINSSLQVRPWKGLLMALLYSHE